MLPKDKANIQDGHILSGAPSEPQSCAEYTRRKYLKMTNPLGADWDEGGKRAEMSMTDPQRSSSCCRETGHWGGGSVYLKEVGRVDRRDAARV